MGEVFAIFGGFLVVLAVAGVAASVRRRKAISALAAVRQWDLQKWDNALPNSFAGRPFRRGRSRVARNVMRGRFHDRSVLVFDYEYRIPGSGDSDTTAHLWVACIDDLPAVLPPLEVVPVPADANYDSPEELGVLAGAPHFWRGDSAFDSRYRVRSLNQQLASDLLSPEVVRLIMSWPDFPWRIEGTRLLTWGPGRVQAHWIDTYLNMLARLAEAVPDEVWRTARGL